MGRLTRSIAAVVVVALTVGTGCSRPKGRPASEPKAEAAQPKTIETFFGIDPFTTEQALGWKDCLGSDPHTPGAFVPGGAPFLRTCQRDDKEKDEDYKVKFVIDDRFPQYKGRLYSIEVELRHLIGSDEARTDAFWKELAKKYGPFISDDGRASVSEVRACRRGGGDCIEHMGILILPMRFPNGPAIILTDDALDATMNKAVEAEQRADGERAAKGR